MRPRHMHSSSNKKHPQPLLEFVNTLRKHEESVYRMLRVAESSNKDQEDLGSVNIIIEASGKLKKMKVEDPADVGTSNASA